MQCNASQTAARTAWVTMTHSTPLSRILLRNSWFAASSLHAYLLDSIAWGPSAADTIIPTFTSSLELCMPVFFCCAKSCFWGWGMICSLVDEGGGRWDPWSSDVRWWFKGLKRGKGGGSRAGFAGEEVRMGKRGCWCIWMDKWSISLG